MPEFPFTEEHVQTIIDGSGLQLTIRNGYVGRGESRASIGFVGHKPEAQVAQLCVRLMIDTAASGTDIESIGEQLVDCLETMRSDRMGHEGIVYLPHSQFLPDEWEDDDTNDSE
jgi:hypothetical protein